MYRNYSVISNISNIDTISKNIIKINCNSHDSFYLSRRKYIADLASAYSSKNTIPIISYLPSETKTWGKVWDNLYPALQRHACDDYLESLYFLQKNCDYGKNIIPQLENVSKFLYSQTKFRLYPVAGLLSPRDFLYGLACKIFFCTQYIRHHSKPFYTPEPDIIHELIGHAPLFANKNFADFSHSIGLASINASDEKILKLSRCYWFSVEFGLCYQNNKRKAYGAGLLSSLGELEYAMSDKPHILSWDPIDASSRDYPITTYQPVYYIANDFKSAKEKFQEFLQYK